MAIPPVLRALLTAHGPSGYETAPAAAFRDAASAYAARFAAKEALVKALGAPPGIRWKDMEITRASGAPGFLLSGVAKDEVERRNATLLLTITHDAGVAAAAVRRAVARRNRRSASAWRGRRRWASRRR